MTRHPIAQKLRAVYTKEAAAAEIRAALDAQQVQLERLWDSPKADLAGHQNHALRARGLQLSSLSSVPLLPFP
jgi:hypothetical protein